MAKLTEEQRDALAVVGRREGWVRVYANRLGSAKGQAQARQQLARRKLIESHPSLRMVWRVTEAGRAALASAREE